MIISIQNKPQVFIIHKNKKMKTIIYILIVVMIGSIVYSAIPQSSNPANIYQNEFTIESNDKILSPNELTVSVKTISKRLEDYGIKLFTIYTIDDKSQIRISFKEKQNLVEIIDLLCSKGQLFFSETYSRNEILSKLNKNDLIFSMLDTEKGDYYSAKLGECELKSTEKLSQHLSYAGFRSQIPENARFVWGKVTAKQPNQLSLYTLKINANKPVVLDGKNISEIRLDTSKEKHPMVFIQFNKYGSALWQKMTYNSMNKSIAILMDQYVYYAPMVKTGIKGGNCVISGNFTENELKSFVAIVKNGELPASFRLK